jgi:HPt (histidine-containing phosphotransfer) domain-containing protein
LARLSGMESLYLRAAKEFVKVIPTVMDEFQHLLEANRKNATMKMHTIKGNAALLGAGALAELTGHLETLCKSNVTTGEIVGYMSDLERTLHGTRIDLQAVIARLDVDSTTANGAGNFAGAVAPANQRGNDFADPSQAAHNVARMRGQLNALAALLVNDDMEALSVFAELRGLFPASIQEHVAPLESAMQNLELEEAHVHCTALLELLGPKNEG